MNTNEPKSNRLWIVSELYYPEDTSTGYYLTQIAEGLASRYPTHVLCAQPTYAVRGSRSPVDEQYAGVNIHRCWGTTWNKDRMLPRLVNAITITFSFFWASLLRLRAGDKVIVVTNPPLLPVAVATVCWLRRAQCILLIHDVYPEAMVAAGMLRQGSLVTVLLQWFVSRLYRMADRIIVLGRDMEHLVTKKLGEAVTCKLEVITHWADNEEVHPLPKGENQFRKRLDLGNRFVAQYAGNLGRCHNVEILVECARRLHHDDNIRFLVAGAGAKKAWFEQVIEDEGLTNVVSLPRQPRERLCELLNAGDVAIVSFVPGMAGISVPSRMYNLLAAGKPILAITDDESELAQVVREEGVGWVIDPSDADALTRAVREASSDRIKLLEMGRRARHAAEHKYQRHLIIDSYERLVASLYPIPSGDVASRQRAA